MVSSNASGTAQEQQESKTMAHEQPTTFETIRQPPNRTNTSKNGLTTEHMQTISNQQTNVLFNTCKSAKKRIQQGVISISNCGKHNRMP
jgi:hypothetical protein